MDIQLVNKIKRLTIIAMASDDLLMESLILKGGNAIDLVLPKGLSRASYDIDYSIAQGDFPDVTIIKGKIERALTQTFIENGYILIDYSFNPKPKKANLATAYFWGGYFVEFKLIDRDQFNESSGNIEKLRREAIPILPGRSPKVQIEFSKFEYAEVKDEITVDGYRIYVYTAEMIVFEKLRAICQQLPQYSEIVPSFTPRARARDFYDIYMIMQQHPIEVCREDKMDLIKHIFDSKRVPVSFIKEIRDHKYIHAGDWESVKDTISATEKIENFDFYFDYVTSTFEGITFP